LFLFVGSWFYSYFIAAAYAILIINWLKKGANSRTVFKMLWIVTWLFLLQAALRLPITTAVDQLQRQCMTEERHGLTLAGIEPPAVYLDRLYPVNSAQECYEACCKHDYGDDDRCNAVVFLSSLSADGGKRGAGPDGDCILLQCDPFDSCLWVTPSSADVNGSTVAHIRRPVASDERLLQPPPLTDGQGWVESADADAEEKDKSDGRVEQTEAGDQHQADQVQQQEEPDVSRDSSNDDKNAYLDELWKLFGGGVLIAHDNKTSEDVSDGDGDKRQQQDEAAAADEWGGEGGGEGDGVVDGSHAAEDQEEEDKEGNLAGGGQPEQSPADYSDYGVDQSADGVDSSLNRHGPSQNLDESSSLDTDRQRTGNDDGWNVVNGGAQKAAASSDYDEYGGDQWWDYTEDGPNTPPMPDETRMGEGNKAGGGGDDQSNGVDDNEMDNRPTADDDDNNENSDEKSAENGIADIASAEGSQRSNDETADFSDSDERHSGHQDNQQQQPAAGEKDIIVINHQVDGAAHVAAVGGHDLSTPMALLALVSVLGVVGVIVVVVCRRLLVGRLATSGPRYTPLNESSSTMVVEVPTASSYLVASSPGIYRD
jgi:hypothetical protein